MVRHGGWIDGFATAVTYYPGSGLIVIVLSNVETTNAGRLARGLATAALRGGREPERRTASRYWAAAAHSVRAFRRSSGPGEVR